MASPSQTGTERSADPRRSSRPRVRSIVPMPAAWPSRCSTARSSNIDGSHEEPGDRRLHLRQGPQVRRARLRPGSAAAIRRSGRDAKARDASSASPGTRRSSSSSERMQRREGRVRRRVDPALLVRRIERPADAGQSRRAAVAAVRHVAARAHGLRGADRRREHGALRQDAVGHLPGLSRGGADHPVGRQPVGVGHSSRAVRPRGAEARREARRRSIRARRRSHASADVHLAVQAGHRRRRRAGHPPLSLRERAAPTRRSSREHTRGADQLRERAEPWTIRARGRQWPASIQPRSSASRELYATSSPALIRCGWGLERNRNGGNAAMAVLALPAVGGKFGVRGGGYSMSNSASWDIDAAVDRAPRAGHARRQHEPSRPRADRVRRSAGQRAVRLQLQSGGDRPGPAARLTRPRARGSLHGRVRAGDDRHGAVRRRRAARDDVPRRATTSRRPTARSTSISAGR